MWSVGIAAIFTCVIRKIPLTSLGWSFGKWKYTWLSLLLPLAYVTIAYSIVWITGVAEPSNKEFIKTLAEKYHLSTSNSFWILSFYFVYLITIGIANSLIAALGEEIGWRGFLAPQLSKIMSFGTLCVVSGVLWSMWHWPLFMLGVYGSKAVNIYYQLFFFTLFLISMSIIMTYVRFKTNNIWNAAILHASHNIWIQKFFTPLTNTTSQSAWYIDEFGAIPSLTAFLFALYFYNKGKKEFGSPKLTI